jgi:hypothetical protein
LKKRNETPLKIFDFLWKIIGLHLPRKDLFFRKDPNGGGGGKITREALGHPSA